MKNANIVIGAAGAIGRALVKELARREPDTALFALSRKGFQDNTWPSNVHAQALQNDNDTAIGQWVSNLKQDGYRVSVAVCVVGMLHGSHEGTDVFPEKKLEDITAEQMCAYFNVNTIVPALWVKQLVTAFNPDDAYLVCLSARVGSIGDNQIGGWYGYRASKAALNMVLKSAAVEYARRSKHTRIISYHPGTVDSNLSSPFQNNVPSGKLFTPAFTANQLLDYLPEASVTSNPHFIDWDHQTISW